MRIFPKLLFLGLFPVFLFGVVMFAVSGELIQPTRTLQSSKKMPGKLSVFSEPSGLDVFLNHSKIGKTPILSMKVASGTYRLRVGDSKTQIDVMPGKSLRLSLFKGTFITLKAPKKEAAQKPATETAEKKPAQPSPGKKEYQPQYDPGYWPLKPNGPIK